MACAPEDARARRRSRRQWAVAHARDFEHGEIGPRQPSPLQHPVGESTAAPRVLSTDSSSDPAQGGPKARRVAAIPALPVQRLGRRPRGQVALPVGQLDRAAFGVLGVGHHCPGTHSLTVSAPGSLAPGVVRTDAIFAPVLGAGDATIPG